MFCAKCGAPLNGAAFCSSCGTAAAGGSTSGPIGGATSGPVPGQYFPPAPKTNPLAIVGFILSLVCFAPAGLVLGIISLNQIKASNGTQGGKGLATAAVVIGAIGTFFIVIYYGVFSRY